MLCYDDHYVHRHQRHTKHADPNEEEAAEDTEDKAEQKPLLEHVREMIIDAQGSRDPRKRRAYLTDPRKKRTYKTDEPRPHKPYEASLQEPRKFILDQAHLGEKKFSGKSSSSWLPELGHMMS